MRFDVPNYYLIVAQMHWNHVPSDVRLFSNSNERQLIDVLISLLTFDKQ